MAYTVKRVADLSGVSIRALHFYSVLEKNLARTQTLIATIDKTIEHVRGTKK